MYVCCVYYSYPSFLSVYQMKTKNIKAKKTLSEEERKNKKHIHPTKIELPYPEDEWRKRDVVEQLYNQPRKKLRKKKEKTQIIQNCSHPELFVLHSFEYECSNP